MFLKNSNGHVTSHYYNYLPCYRNLGLLTPATGKPVFPKSEPFSQDFNNTLPCFSTFRGVYTLRDIKGFLKVVGMCIQI